MVNGRDGAATKYLITSQPALHLLNERIIINKAAWNKIEHAKYYDIYYELISAATGKSIKWLKLLPAQQNSRAYPLSTTSPGSHFLSIRRYSPLSHQSRNDVRLYLINDKFYPEVKL